MSEEKNSDSRQTDTGDLFAQDSPEKRLDQVKSLIQSIYHNLDKLSRTVDRIQQEQKKELYKKMPGIEGVFDGFYLVADDSSKHEVPSNYAAKSRLVYGDRLKIVDEDGKKVFKQIQKPERKEVKGILSKKEGKWYLLTDVGTYKVSDVAAEFNRVGLNEEAVGLIPENQPNVPFAALDRVIKKEESVVVEKSHHVEKMQVREEPKKEFKPVPARQVKITKAIPLPVKPREDKKEDRKEVKKPFVRTEKSTEPVLNQSKEFVAGILEDDDLR
jgi:hypothetical protein